MVKGSGSVGLTHQCVPIWILFFCHMISAEVLKSSIYFTEDKWKTQIVQAPALTNGTEFSWEWKPHHGGQNSTQLATVTMPSQRFSWKRACAFWKEAPFDLGMYKVFLNAGVFSFKQTKPAVALLARFEVFAVRLSPFPEVQVGLDVSSRCEISRLPKSVILQWERKGDPRVNTTRLYNNSAYIIIHNANLQCNGEYTCSVRKDNGRLIVHAISTLRVTKYTYGKHSTLYRSSYNSNEVELTCQSTREYQTAKWSWEQPAKALETLASADKDKSVQIERKTDRRRFSFSAFNGKHFSLRIAPVMFEDSGLYTCHFEHYNFAQVTLVNIQVSVEPPGGVFRHEPAVLTCEVSDVTERLTLVWLRMEGHRGVLVKQEVLEMSESVGSLSLTLPGLTGDQLHWECAVFTESMLRARAPVHLTLQAGNMALIVAVCVGVAMLTSALLLFYYRRRTAAALGASPGTGNDTSIPLDAISSEVTDLLDKGDKAVGTEVLYSSVILGVPSSDQRKRFPATASERQSENVVYSVFNIT
ncbi:uncharacterized protein LOC133116988 isoform X2 [Conger conger]|uniref:uncharacterized protein LOC133116988 isoform X2 n=1 Tax=Conger conger TaxID=82655 RepID=UPI002A5AA9A0|nr:uncharacterized protein LOC133116988 isoform X2 [Conger conger]